jgi:hypothetical protein
VPDESAPCHAIILFKIRAKIVLCEGNIKMGWIDLALDRVRLRAFVNAVMNLRVPYNAGNFLSS